MRTIQNTLNYGKKIWVKWTEFYEFWRIFRGIYGQAKSNDTRL